MSLDMLMTQINLDFFGGHDSFILELLATVMSTSNLAFF